ncbi:MAG: type II toxin-antitoxin system HicB family antitoxin [Clostridia bacterium]|nr:MAG: type II toxin-antitoxin system HicB family antitoxin [Clostridia bacterium]
MGFYTVVLRKTSDQWVALCLENGCVGQGSCREEAVEKLKVAVSSLLEASYDDPDIYTAPVPIKELHEFLTFGGVVYSHK